MSSTSTGLYATAQDHFGTFDAVGWGHPPHQFTSVHIELFYNLRRKQVRKGVLSPSD